MEKPMPSDTNPFNDPSISRRAWAWCSTTRNLCSCDLPTGPNRYTMAVTAPRA